MQQRTSWLVAALVSTAVAALAGQVHAQGPTGPQTVPQSRYGAILGLPRDADKLYLPDEAYPGGEIDPALPARAVTITFDKGVPFINDLAKNDDDRKAIEFLYAGQGIGRPFLAPPGLAPNVLKMMRTAFDATMKDADFIAEVKQKKLTLEPENGEYLEQLINRIYATPKPIVERIANLIK